MTKILVLGLGQNNFLSFLYGHLLKKFSNISVSAPYITELDKRVSHNTSIYDNGKISKDIPFLYYLRAVLSITFSLFFYRCLILLIFSGEEFIKVLYFIHKQITRKAFFLRNNHFDEYDTFHFHFIEYSYVQEVFFIPKNKKIVCSFWGSDLMRTNGTFNQYFIKMALQRADIITCQSIEMREIILSKYGRSLIPKIEVVTFILDERIFIGIEQNRGNEERVEAFKNKFNYSKKVPNVMVGHNGNPENNHLEIIEALTRFPDKNRFKVVINLNYGIRENEREAYKQKLTDLCENAGMSYSILENFFTPDELVLSRLASDIYIHLPISDALSGTLTEMLYAGNRVITGSWLPYKTFISAGIKYREVDCIDDLRGPLKILLNQHSTTDKEELSNNIKAIDNYFFSSTIADKWLRVLQK